MCLLEAVLANGFMTGCSAARLAHLLREQGVGGSNPPTPTISLWRNVLRFIIASYNYPFLTPIAPRGGCAERVFLCLSRRDLSCSSQIERLAVTRPIRSLSTTIRGIRSVRHRFSRRYRATYIAIITPIFFTPDIHIAQTAPTLKFILRGV